jgi:hypothetical protein
MKNNNYLVKIKLDAIQDPLTGYIGCGGWIRTNDLRVMSPTSYQTAPPRAKVRALYMHTQLFSIGADGRTRTGTAVGYHPLKMACLPISPHRHVSLSRRRH